MKIGIWATNPEARRILRTLIERTGETVAWERNRHDNPFIGSDRRDIIFVAPRSHIELVGSLQTFRQLQANCSRFVMVGKEKMFPPLLANLVSVGVAGSFSPESSADLLLTCLITVDVGNYYFGLPVSRLEIREHINNPSLRGFTASPRQLEIWKYLFDGLTPKQVANKLGMNPDTVKAHKFSLMRRLGIHKQKELIQEAIRHALPKPHADAMYM